MVAGHLQEKNGIYHAVLSFNDEYGKRKTKWISTEFSVKGNKKKAEQKLNELRKEFVPPKPIARDAEQLFSDYMLEWLQAMKPNIESVTFAGYTCSVEKVIVPYFKETGIVLKDLKASDIQRFYIAQQQRVMVKSSVAQNKTNRDTIQLDFLQRLAK